ncbi:hypothetical protein BJ742DRAFT_778101 [Cladochytrium replicatum]|nr:hypothetical protein BJ742DRAFT_778101 [Cladochytrium replicatum]
MAPRYYLLVASRDHILKGIEGNFLQQRHPHRLERLKAGDYIVVYAAKQQIGKDSKANRCRKVLGIAQAVDGNCLKLTAEEVLGTENAAACSSKVFYRKTNLQFIDDFVVKDFEPLIPRLGFVKNKSRWGLSLMRGFVEISKDDFDVFRS